MSRNYGGVRILDATIQKTCNRCGITKSLASFSKNSHLKSGVRSTCRECDSIRNKGRKLTPEQMAHQTALAATRGHDLKRKQAKHRVQTAVRGGRLTKWPVCALPECEERRVEAHHADYDNPLGVTWLCAKHHRLAHTMIRSDQ